MKTLPFILILLALLLLSCSRSNIADSTGGGTETTNPKIVGKVVTVDNKPAENVIVELIPNNYDPLKGDSTSIKKATTDSGGNFYFEEFSAGEFNVIASTNDQSFITLKENVVIKEVGKNDITISEIKLDSASILAISTHNLDSGEVYIPGTNIQSTVDSMAKEVMVLYMDVPAGVYDEIIYLDLSDSSKTDLVEDTLEVDPGVQKEILPYEYWPSSAKISLQPGVASLNSDVTDFPLAVRLHSADVQWSQFQEKGRDIRITKSDKKTNLCFDIELLDVINEEAVLWIKVDTVFAGIETQEFYLYYGYPYAESLVGNCPVFDSTYSSLYHLDSLASDKDAGLLDASPYANHGNTSLLSEGALQMEYLGKGLNLNDSNEIVEFPLPKGYKGESSFTISFWFKYQIPAHRMSVFHFGDHGPLNGFHFLIRPDSTFQIGPFDVSGQSQTKPFDVSDRQNWFNAMPWVDEWVYITTVYDVDLGTVSTYMNKNFIASDTLSRLHVAETSKVILGREILGKPEMGFNNVIDEIRFRNDVIDANRRRLNYFTQKLGSGAVVIE